MPAPNILVVVVDGLRASALGAYGNTSFATPALDQFAAESFLLDWCYAPAAELDAVYRAAWQSFLPARDALRGNEAASLPRLLATVGYRTTLVSDDPALASLVAAADFSERVDLASNGHPETRAEDVSQTSIAQLFTVACDVVASTTSHSPRLIWVHARGMYGPWDAPLELQQSLLDEGDPLPVETVAPPDISLAASDDLDAGFRYGCAYAAQVMVLDSCWEVLLQSIESAAAADEWIVMLLGARGFPLGEHRRVGGVDARMYGEQLHVPWLLKFPGAFGRLARSCHLTSHVDLLPTLLDSIGDGAQAQATRFDGMSIRPFALSSRAAWREALVFASSEGHRVIRTAEWCLRQDAATGDQQTAHDSATTSPRELYVRPDDRWETNDVAKLCPDVVETLSRAIDDEVRQLQEPAAHVRD